LELTYLGRNHTEDMLLLNYLDDLDQLRAMRNLRRYIQNAKAVMLNVQRVDFRESIEPRTDP
jgi:hypothetical protein